MLLIGSRALSVIGHAAILCGRTPGDTDLIGTWEEFQAMLASLTDIERVLLDPTGNKIAVKSRYYGHILRCLGARSFHSRVRSIK